MSASNTRCCYVWVYAHVVFVVSFLSFRLPVETMRKHIFMLLFFSSHLISYQAKYTRYNHTSLSHWTCRNTCWCMVINEEKWWQIRRYFTFHHNKFKALIIQAMHFRFIGNCHGSHHFDILNANCHFIIDTFHILNLIYVFMVLTQHTKTGWTSNDVNNNMTKDHGILFVCSAFLAFLVFFSDGINASVPDNTLFILCFRVIDIENWVSQHTPETRLSLQSTKEYKEIC